MTEADPAFVAAAPTPLDEMDLVLLVEPFADESGRLVDARILHVNEPWKATFGVAGRDVAGLNLLEAFPMLGGERWDAIVRATTTRTDQRLRVRHPVDPARSAAVQLTPIGSSVLVVAREMTVEDALREQLHASDVRFRQALEQVPETISILRPVTDETGRLVDVEPFYLNATARERWFDGRAMEELAGVRVFAANPAVREALEDIYREVHATGHPYEGIRSFALGERRL